MKNATVYEKKVRKLLSGAPRVKPSADEVDPVRVLLEAILSADAARRSVQQAVDGLRKEFVDYNELRVAPAKDIADRIGRGFPDAREKAQAILRALNSVFDRTGTMTTEYMTEMSRKDLRRHLAEIGLSPYSAAYVMLTAMRMHAVPVDASLVDALKMEGAVDPACDIEDAQGFLERVVAQKDDGTVHEFFRSLVEKNAKAIAKWRKANPDLATRPPEILPPPKFQMLAKSQPLPLMKGDEGFEESEVEVAEVLEEVQEEVIGEPGEEVEDLDLSVVGELEGIEGESEPKPAEPEKGKPAKDKPKPGKPAAKAKGKSKNKKK